MRCHPLGLTSPSLCVSGLGRQSVPLFGVCGVSAASSHLRPIQNVGAGLIGDASHAMDPFWTFIPCWPRWWRRSCGECFWVAMRCTWDGPPPSMPRRLWVLPVLGPMLSLTSCRRLFGGSIQDHQPRVGSACLAHHPTSGSYRLNKGLGAGLATIALIHVGCGAALWLGPYPPVVPLRQSEVNSLPGRCLCDAQVAAPHLMVHIHRPSASRVRTWSPNLQP